MFWAIYRYSTKKTGEYVIELSLSFPKLKTELKNSHWFIFYCCFCLAQLKKNDSLFWGHIGLSQPILKILSWNSPDKLILILWSQIWNHIFNIKSLWCHCDVIFLKVSKTTSFASKNLPIYIDSDLQITLFLVGITKITYFLLIWVKKAKHLIYNWKMGPYLLEKRTSCWWCHQNMRNVYYVKSNFFNVKYYVCQIFLPSFNTIE